MKDVVRVLVVDDDAAVRASLRAYLEDEGFEVSSAGAAGEALVILGAGRIDVAIVDIRLPEMDGQTLILRAHELAPSVRYVIYTGSVAYQLPEALERMGMTPEDVLHKPARSLELLVAAVRQVAAKEIDRV